MNAFQSKAQGIFGLLGSHIGYSLSPRIHNYIFHKYGINAVYGLFDLEPEIFRAGAGILISSGIGFNITVPYKEAIIQFVSDLSPEAKLTGSVNLVSSGTGYNTDFMALKDLVGKDLEGMSASSCAIFGSGGAGRTAAFLLGKAGLSVTIYNRTRERAEKLCNDLRNSGIKADFAGISDSFKNTRLDCDCVVNAISDPDFAFPETRTRLIIDFSYGTRSKRFRDSVQTDIRTITGEQILVGQAIHSQRIWNGIKPSFDEIMEVLDVQHIR